MNPRQALVIGINQYHEDDLPDLTYAVDDAEAIATILKEQGDFNVTRRPLCTDENNRVRVHPTPDTKKMMTLERLTWEIGKFFCPEGEQIPEIALLFFAGHGLYKKFEKYHSFLATVDSNPEQKFWGYDLDKLQESLKHSKIREKIVWLDACHSGALIRDFESQTDTKWCLISATPDHDIAGETRKKGIFTKALLKALDYQKNNTGSIDSHALVKNLEAIRKADGITQQFIYENSDQPILLTGQHLADKDERLQGVCPYKGLLYFDSQYPDTLFYKGRTALTAQLLEQVKQQRFVVVLGASGSGKSSLVRAGLIHQLETLQTGHYISKHWQIIRPGATPLAELTTVLASIAQKYSEHLLIIDQFEEVFSPAQDEKQREAFFEQLLALTDFYLVIVMRSDFFAHCIAKPYAGLADKMKNNLFTITSMTTAELKQAIEEPAKKVGFRVQNLLTLEIIKDMEGSPSNLPLLQYTLEKVFQAQDTNQQLTLVAYQQLGGIKGALTTKADELYQSFSDSEQETVKWLFLELTQLGEEQEVTRKQLTLPELEKNLAYRAGLSTVIAKLTTERLLIRDQNSSHVTIIDVVHEALIREWARLHAWIDENRSALTKKREIEPAAKDWEVHGKSKAYLWQGPKLAMAEDYVNNDVNKVPLSDLAQEFVGKSIKYRQIKQYILISMGTMVILVFIGFAFYANEQRIEAERQKDKAKIAQLKAEKSEQDAKEQTKIALSERLGTQSILATQIPSIGNGYYEQALLLAIQAFKEKNIGTSRSNLLRVLQAKKQQKAFLYGHSDDVTSVVFSPDGQTLASGSLDNTVRLWDVKTKQPLGELLVGHFYGVLSVTFSFDGKTIALGSWDTVRLWDVETRQPLGKPLVGHSNDVLSVAFSPNNQTLASGSRDQTVKLWNIETRQPLGEPLVGHSDDVNSVVFSPDGKILASGSYDNTVKLWDVETRQSLGERLVDHSDDILSVAFSPDGQTLALGSSDNTVILWNVETRQQLGKPLVGHSDGVNSVVFSPDGKILASGSFDKTMRLWNVKTRQPLSEPLVGHSDSVISMAFNPYGDTIASGSWDNTVRLWNIESQTLAPENSDGTVRLLDVQPPGEPLVGYSDSVTSVVFSPDNQIFASGNVDGTVRLWDVQMRQPLGEPLVGHSDYVTSVAFSHDGKTLASGSFDGTVRLWNVQMRQPLGEPLVGHSDYVTSLAFSPDGQTLASGNSDGTVRLWDVQTRQPFDKPLVGHDDVILSMVFSSDGKTLASAGRDNTVRLWDIQTKQPLGESLIGHSDFVFSVAFSPDGKTLASGSADETVILWDVETRQPLGEPLVGHSDSVTNVIFRLDGKILESESSDNTMKSWDIDLAIWAKQACAIVNRNFSHEEWRKYMGNHRPHEKTCPNLPKDTLGAIELAKQARKLLEEGKTELAKAKFAQAREWDASVVFGDEGLE